MTRQELFEEIKQRLGQAFGDRLQGIVLYGSEARGESKDDSDIDFLILLQGPVELWSDLKTIIHMLYPLQLELLDRKEWGDSRVISAIPVDKSDYDAGKSALFRNARKEGVLI